MLETIVIILIAIPLVLIGILILFLVFLIAMAAIGQGVLAFINASRPVKILSVGVIIWGLSTVILFTLLTTRKRIISRKENIWYIRMRL